MERIFSRRYNNTVVFFLGLAAASVVGAIVYWLYFSKKTEKIKDGVEGKSSPDKKHSGKPTLVLFYSETCGNCKVMKNDWAAASDVLRKAGLVEVLEFEASKDAKTMQAVGDITGFPDIRLYPEGFPSNNYINYSGDRSEESLIQFAYSSPTETPV